MSARAGSAQCAASASSDRRDWAEVRRAVAASGAAAPAEAADRLLNGVISAPRRGELSPPGPEGGGGGAA